MSGLIGSISTERTEVATGTAEKTLLQLVAPTNQRGSLRSFGVTFDAAALAAAVEVHLAWQTSAGTSSAATVRKVFDFTETLQFTGRNTVTVEPTLGYAFRSYNIQPASGGIERAFNYGELWIPGGDRLGLLVHAPATVNAHAWLEWEE